MGTRGIHGFSKGGKFKISYNQYDMYPTGVGADLAKELRDMSVRELNEAWKRIRLVSGKRPPSDKNKERYAGIGNLDVSTGSMDDWYCVLRNCQGTLIPWVKGIVTSRDYNSDTREWTDNVYKLEQPVGHMLDASDFVTDSLFCEWGYIVNLDNNTFEVYRGYQKAPHNDGPFANRKVHDPEHRSDTYYPIALVAVFPLSDLPDDAAMERLEKMVYGPDEEDPSIPDISNMPPREVGKRAMGKEPTYREKSVGRIEKCAALYEDPEEADTVVKDMLADLLHVCDAKGLDFSELSVKAHAYYMDETAHDQGRITIK